MSGWASSQRQLADGAVESEQRVGLVEPAVPYTRDGAARLGERYWVEVVRATGRLVRARPRGDQLALELRATRIALLVFGPPELVVEPRLVRCSYPILGGVLARRAAGEISFEQAEEERPVLRSSIRGFYPALAAREGRRHWTGALYTSVQSRIHVAISRRYFARLATGAHA